MLRIIIAVGGGLLLMGCGATVESPVAVAHSTPDNAVTDNHIRLPVATPTPAPTATPAPVQPVAQNGSSTLPLRPPTNPPLPPPPPPANIYRIIGPGVNVGIGSPIGNCNSNFRVVPGGSAHFDSCQPGMWIDCDISTCPAINGWGRGTVVHYFDGAGVNHTYTIQFVQTGTAGQRMSVYGSVHFQVCQRNVSNGTVTVVSA